ncbi:hypothetical protein DAPPUDRAFT_118104 [Daphnia pulex]|uniref:Uncharacterized protein n=1 Tax=Daphnia pulex TaxID=6669 RepID=E9HUR1_DAPPU|nr:hypothetical protein DAPPUDRAFT_118104 [Daphnia pulex]|eukprot:EFX64515.1 hypothetical protein DAPPUDRAFT_118104 [Daphnia pulex]
MDRPTKESSRRHLKGYVTKWINEINNNKNVTMDLRSSSYLWMAEIRLLSLYSRFKQYSYGVLRDLAVFQATQQEFDHEQDLQRAMQSEVEEALAIVKTKREDYKAQQGKEGVEEDSSDTPFFVDEPIRLHRPRSSPKMEHAQTCPTPDVVAVMTQSLMTQQPASPPDVYSIAVMTKSSSKMIIARISYRKANIT